MEQKLCRCCLITGVKFTLNSFLMLFVIFYVNSSLFERLQKSTKSQINEQAGDCERVKNNNSLISWQRDTNRWAGEGAEKNGNCLGRMWQFLVVSNQKFCGRKQMKSFKNPFGKVFQSWFRFVISIEQVLKKSRKFS